MNSLVNFRNKNENSSIIVCGCGESLNDLTRPQEFITIGVNDVGRRFQPNYLVVVNPKNQFSGDRFRYVETSQAEYLFTQLDLPVKHPNVVKFKLGTFGGTDFFDANVLHYTNNSPYIAVCLAILMGAKRIGIIGVDFTDHHFFAETGKHPLAPQFDAINDQYSRLAKAAESVGIEIFNLSKISRLTAFPKISVDEFANLPQAEIVEKSGSLKIVSYATTPVAGVPAILARCINARTEHSARCVWAADGYGNGVKFAGDVEWQNEPQKAEKLLSEADLIIVHNGKIAPAHEKIFGNKAVVTMAHNYLWNVDERFVKQGFPSLIVGQYQATLDEFKSWSVVPNPIPFWENEYQPGEKNEQITICYTPSGKHEKYPLEHKLYWHSKGYETTVEILKKLAGRFQVKLEIIEDRQVSHAESLAMKRRSHIVIDECVTGSYHRNSLEGLVCGTVVVNGLGILPKVGEILRVCAGEAAGNPFVSATLENLEAVLTNLIEGGRENLIRRGAKNRLWIEENWNFEAHWRNFWLPEIEKSLQKANRGFVSEPAKTAPPAALSNIPNGVQKMSNFKEGISVVIPHGGRDRLPHLRACLANLRQCANIGEIIVVEMDERPAITEIARRRADKYVFIKRFGEFERARTLNVGSALAECEFVLWLDNDLLMSPDFFTKAVAEMRARKLDYLRPYAETDYLNAAESSLVMQGTLDPAFCRPAKVDRASPSGRAEIVRKDFLQLHGGIPEGFRGWGGEDNAWAHKASLLGRAGDTQHKEQKLVHLYHSLSGGYGGESHKTANPHYNANVALLNQIFAVRDRNKFSEKFPPCKYAAWETSQKIVFVASNSPADINAAHHSARQFEELFGTTVEVVEFEKDKTAILEDLAKTQADAFVFFDQKSNFSKLYSRKNFVKIADKSILISNEDWNADQSKMVTIRQNAEAAGNNSRVWGWKNESPETPDFQSLALALAQPLSIILGAAKTDLPAVRPAKSDLPIWIYWEGAKPDWIERCIQTILAKNPNARFLTPEIFDVLWTTDRDIDISRLQIAHRADYIRAYLLANYGGLWVDADCIMLRNLDFLLEKLNDYDFIAHRERSDYFSNAFIAARPRSVIANQLYESICRTLRSKANLGWISLGGEPLTKILQNAPAAFYELSCEQVQPVCWSRPEIFFASGSEAENSGKFNRQAFCYMLSNREISNFRRKNPQADLMRENTFFSFLSRFALDKRPFDGNGASDLKPLKVNEDRRRTLTFYLEMFAKIAPRKVLDVESGSRSRAILLRELFESENNDTEDLPLIEALVETQSEAEKLSCKIYNRVQSGDLSEYLHTIENKRDLLILGDYFRKRPNVRYEGLLQKSLEVFDYVLLNLNRTQNGEMPDLYPDSHPEEVVANCAGEDSTQFVLSRRDPKNLHPAGIQVEIFEQTAQNFRRLNEESISGPGCSLSQTRELRRSLPLLVAHHDINSMLDARCGDFNWMRHIELNLGKYIGIDLVASTIEANRRQFEARNRQFFKLDVTRDFLPVCDLIFCRDFLVHLSFAKIFSALRNFSRSGAKYLLTTTFPQTSFNHDIQDGDWRTLNFQLPPFNFPPPPQLINERSSEANGKFSDKSLGFWKFSAINI